MKKIILFIFLIISFLTIEAQSTSIKALFENEEYSRIINFKDSISRDSAKSYYYVGMAFYRTENDSNCIEFMNKSIEIDPNDPAPRYIKGMALNYMGDFKAAISAFNNAIKIDSLNGKYFSGLGDSYYMLGELDKSLENFINSSNCENTPDRAYIMIPQLYLDLNQKDEALKNFYVAKNRISRDSDSFLEILYNIGLTELLNRNYTNAESAFQELIENSPTDYMSYSKLIQVYYGSKEYEKARPLRNILYEAHIKGLLNGNIKDQYCFDQFKWKDKLIQVWERFNETEGEIYYKHLFYVLDERGEIEYRIQTENMLFSTNNDGLKYILGMNKGDVHSTFNVGFSEDFEYENLKESVVDILEGKLKPTASSERSKK